MMSGRFGIGIFLFQILLQSVSKMEVKMCASTQRKVEKFVVKAVHQIYIDLRTLYTVAFHHEGIYSVRAKIIHSNHDKTQQAFPFIFKDEDNHQNQTKIKLDYKELSIQTKKFQVKHNAQHFELGARCRFKLQFEEKQENQTITLQLELIKHPDAQPTANKLNSSEDLLKGEINQSSQNQTAQNKKNAISQFNTKSAKIQKKVVSTCKLNINTTLSIVERIQDQFRKMIFADHEYFCILYAVVSHIKTGYEIRTVSDSLCKFYQQKKQRGSKNKERNSLSSQSDKERKKRNIVASSLQEFQPNLVRLYEKLILDQMQILERLSDFMKEIEKQMMRCFGFPLLDFRCPVQKLIQKSTEDSLQELYQTQNTNQIPYIIFCQSKALQQHTFINWHKLLTIFSSKISDIFYYKFQMRGCKKQIEGLKSIKNIQEIKKRLQNQKQLKKDKRSLTSSLSSLFQARKSGEQENNRMISYSLFELHPEHKRKYESDAYETFPEMELVEKKHMEEIMDLQHPQYIGMSHENTLFVLVHGLNGNQFDLSTIKAHINSLCIITNILTIKKIEEKFDLSIEQLGRQCADEVIQYVESNIMRIRKINFIGYSLGGVIIRASLKHLMQYSGMFNVMITLSTPHLGVTQNRSCLVRTYTNMMKKFSKNKIFKEISLFEEKKGEGGCGYLEELAKEDFIRSFKLVIFLGADMDLYVPLYSSTLSYENNDQKIMKMQRDLWKRIRNCHLINIRFNQKNKSSFWDRVLLKKVHCNFLDDNSFLYFFFSQYYLML